MELFTTTSLQLLTQLLRLVAQTELTGLTHQLLLFPFTLLTGLSTHSGEVMSTSSFVRLMVDSK
jgi:hypothetical protein